MGEVDESYDTIHHGITQCNQCVDTTDIQTIDDLIKQDLRIDPDLWVVEIEDRHGRHFLEETVKKFR